MVYRGGSKAGARLKYDHNIYTPSGLLNITEKERRAEYSRLRAIAVKRLKRFEGTEWESSQQYLKNVGEYKTLKNIKSDSELRHLLTQLSDFIEAKTSTVSGLERQRREAVKTFNERGYNFINKQNFRKFGEFMEYARATNLNIIHGSEKVAEFFEYAEKQKYSTEQVKKAFKSWSKKQIKENKLQNKNKKSSSQYRKALE